MFNHPICGFSMVKKRSMQIFFAYLLNVYMDNMDFFVTYNAYADDLGVVRPLAARQ